MIYKPLFLLFILCLSIISCNNPEPLLSEELYGRWVEGSWDEKSKQVVKKENEGYSFLVFEKNGKVTWITRKNGDLAEDQGDWDVNAENGEISMSLKKIEEVGALGPVYSFWGRSIKKADNGIVLVDILAEPESENHLPKLYFYKE